MQYQHNTYILPDIGTIQMIDGEFDHFEMNNDFEMVLREAETANFYHDALSEEE